MGYFKFLSTRYLKRTMSGQFSFGRLDYYRLLEIVTANAWIGDREEGENRTFVERLDSSTPESRRLMRHFGLNFEQSGAYNITVQNSTVINSIDAFVLSLAAGRYEELAPVFATNRPGVPGYTACIEIVDIDQFCSLLDRATVVHGGPRLVGRSIGELFPRSRYRGLVDYTAGPRAVDHPRAFYGDPFRKREMYREQSEFRLVFGPISEDIVGDRIVLNVPVEDGLLRLVSAGLEDEPQTNPPSFEELRSNLSALVTEAFRLSARDEGRPWTELRGQLTTAYWALRGQLSDPAVDRAILDGDDVPTLAGHLSRFMARLTNKGSG